MKRKIWLPTVAGTILVFGTAANMSNDPSQSPSDDSVVINDWLIVGEPSPTPSTPGSGSLMVGYGNSATGVGSAAIGQYNNSVYDGSLTVGWGNNADYYNGVAMGTLNNSTGDSSVAMGAKNISTGYNSLAMGYRLAAHGFSTVVVGKYNESIFANSDGGRWEDNQDGHLFVVGNGIRDKRSNAMVVYHDGAVDVGKHGSDDTVPLQVTSDGSVVLAKEQGDISMGAFGASGN